MASRLALAPLTEDNGCAEAAYSQTQLGLLGTTVKCVPERPLGFSCTQSPHVN